MVSLPAQTAKNEPRLVLVPCIFTPSVPFGLPFFNAAMCSIFGRFMVAAGGLEQGLNTAVNAAPLMIAPRRERSFGQLGVSGSAEAEGRSHWILRSEKTK